MGQKICCRAVESLISLHIIKQKQQGRFVDKACFCFVLFMDRKKIKLKRNDIRQIKFVIKLSIFVIFPLVFLMSFISTGFAVFGPSVEEMYTEGMEMLEQIDSNTFTRRSDTQIFDKNGQLISEINVTNYQYVPYDQISPYLTKAYIAVEDQNFLTHNGLDWKGIMRAAASLVVNHGEITQGGSTITQQVIKNNMLIDRGRVERKVMEIFMAPKLEDILTKEQIMEAYCNTNCYANNCYGIETASQYYYGKHASELTLGEAATMAGLSNWPAEYDPKANPEKALEKRNNVLNAMLDNGSISVPEYLLARQEEPVYVFLSESRVQEDYLTSYAIHCATEELMAEQGFAFQYKFETEDDYNNYHKAYDDLYTQISSDIRLGGYKIYTSLDQDVQAQLQQYLDASVSDYTEMKNGIYALQSAAVVVDNDTGYVIAIVGGRSGSGEYNRGYQAVRQPGSAIKPIVDYGPAFDSGLFYPSKEILDEYIPNGPHNSYSGYRGYMSIKEAIARSCNTIAYKTLQDIGVGYGMDYLEALHFSHLSYLDNDNTSLSIGGWTNGATVAEMAKGYATIAAGGTYTDHTCITKIEFMNSGTVFEDQNDEYEVYTPDTAYMLLDSMKDVLNAGYGTGRSRSLDGIIAAAKTGTTDESKDVWFCGLSKYYSVAVWCGYDMPRGNSGISGAGQPGYTWQHIMEYLHEGLPVSDFERPDTVIDRYINGRGDPVDYNTGNTGLFSTIAQKRAEEEARRIAEEKERQRQESIQQSFTDALEELNKTEFTSYDQVPEIDNAIANARSIIDQITDEATKENDLAALEQASDRIYQDGELKYEPGSIFFYDQLAPGRIQQQMQDTLNGIQAENQRIQALRDDIDRLTGIQSITGFNYSSVSWDLRNIENRLDTYYDDVGQEYVSRFYEQQNRIYTLMEEYDRQQEEWERQQQQQQEQQPVQQPDDLPENTENGQPETPAENPETAPPAQPETPGAVEDPEGMTDEDREKIDYAQRLIEFLSIVDPNDIQLDSYIDDAERAVDACAGLDGYEALREMLRSQVEELRGLS